MNCMPKKSCLFLQSAYAINIEQTLIGHAGFRKILTLQKKGKLYLIFTLKDNDKCQQQENTEIQITLNFFPKYF